LLQSLAPTEVWWSTTSRTIVYRSLLRQLSCPVVAMLTGPLYEWGELWRASSAGVPFAELKSHWLQRFVPRRLFISLLQENIFCAVYVQSESNRQRLIQGGLSECKIAKVPVGIDESDRTTMPHTQALVAREQLGIPSDSILFGYFGALRPVRGYAALMKAFPKAASQASNIHLAIFARGADEARCNAIREQTRAIGIADRITVVGGWLSREDVLANMQACDAIVLPFVIVESDVPIAILEALARGRPVITSPVDGIPELVEGRGLIVDPLDNEALALAMVRLGQDGALLRRLSDAAGKFMETYPAWDTVSEKMRNDPT